MLRTLLALTRHGTITATAEAVALTPAAVSQQMAQLEADLGQSIFDRRGKAVRLNANGHRVVEGASQIVRIYETLQTQACGAGELSGRIRLGSIATAMAPLTQAILTLQANYPRIDVKPVVSFSDDLLSKVASGELDAALSPQLLSGTPSGVTWTPLYKEPLVFIANRASSKSRSMGALCSERCFFKMPSNNQTGAAIDRIIKTRRLKLKQIFEMNSIRTMIELVEQDVGIAIVPLPLGSRYHLSKLLRIDTFEGVAASRSIGLFENDEALRLTSLLRDLLLARLSDPDGVLASPMIMPPQWSA